MWSFGIMDIGNGYAVVCDNEDANTGTLIAAYSEMSNAVELIHYLNGGASNILELLSKGEDL